MQGHINTFDDALTEIARLQDELSEANACHETALNIARAGTEHIAMLQAEVERLSRLQGFIQASAIIDAEILLDTRWNDAVEAAARAYENGGDGDSWDYFQDAYDAIRALRKP